MRRTRPAALARTPRPSAADIWRLVAVARPWLAGAVIVGFGQAVLLVAQADVLARLLAGALYRELTAPEAGGDCLRVALLALGQGSLGWAWEACTEAAARRARMATRQRALAASVRLASPGLSAADEADGRGAAPGPGGMTTLLASGLDELDPFVARVLPRVVLASREELAAVEAADWALAQLADRERTLGARTWAVAAAAGLERASAALAGGAGLAGVVGVGAAAQRSGRISPVELGVLVFVALAVSGLLQGLPDAVSRLPVGRASLRRLADLSRLPDPVVAHAGDGSLHERATTAEPASAWAHRGTATVTLREAALTYPQRQNPVLRGLDLELAPGRPVALAGPSGSGKTSIVLALLRFIRARPVAGSARARSRHRDRALGTSGRWRGAAAPQRGQGLAGQPPRAPSRRTD